MHLNDEARGILKIYLEYELKLSPKSPFTFRLGVGLLVLMAIIPLFQRAAGFSIPVWEVQTILLVGNIATVTFAIGAGLFMYRNSLLTPAKRMQEQFALDEAFSLKLVPFRKEVRKHFLDYIMDDWAVKEKALQTISGSALAAIAIIVVYTERNSKPVPMAILLVAAIVGLFLENTKSERVVSRAKRFAYILNKQDGLQLINQSSSASDGGPGSGLG